MLTSYRPIVKECIVLREMHLRTTGRHLSNGITQCYLLPVLLSVICTELCPVLLCLTYLAMFYFATFFFVLFVF